jgi:hypothetical protein
VLLISNLLSLQAFYLIFYSRMEVGFRLGERDGWTKKKLSAITALL